MIVQSKSFEIRLPYNCYEIFHPWTPHCSRAALDMGFTAIYEGAKIYFPLYLIAQVLQKKYDFDSFRKTFRNACRSTIFLSANGFLLILIACGLRKFTGRIDVFNSVYIPSFTSCFLAIFIEQKSRRKLLAMYLTNLASETVFRMGIERGLVKSIPGAEVYLFSSSMALLLYMFRKRGFSRDVICLILKHLIGTAEFTHTRNDTISNSTPGMTNPLPLLCKGPPNRVTLFSRMGDIWRKFWNVVKHSSCSHKQSCFHYALEGFLRPLFLGSVGSLGLRLLRFATAKKNPADLLRILTDHKNFYLGIFLGGFAGTYRSTSCCCRWLFGKDMECYALPAGFAGGLFMKFNPSSTIALYVMWKLVEVAYLAGIQKGILPEIKGSMIALFCTSGAIIVSAIILEPHSLKPTYWKFVVRMFEKILLINRPVIEVIGTRASKLNPDFFPDLDEKHVSRSFLENVLLWTIQ